MFSNRLELYKRLEEDRGSRVIVYITGDRRGLETKISAEVMDLFIHHLDHIGVVDKLTLYLYTRGGDTLAAWSLINLLRIFADHLEVIVPSKAHSAGTLLCLGADSIIMTKQAALGPIDPAVHTPLNPQIIGAAPNAKVPVSVESINGFIEFARQTLGKDADLKEVFVHLATTVHPLVLGDAFRARGQIRMLASRLLARHNKSQEEIDTILEFLCSESGSHDYTINRREARDQLDLPIVSPNAEQYEIIKAIYDDVASELDFDSPYEPNVILGTENTRQYSLPRALIETRKGGSHVFQSEGMLSKQQVHVQPGMVRTKENLKAGGTEMTEVKESLPVIFLRYTGTENGLANQDTTACTDSLASMIANSIAVLDSAPSRFESTIEPVQDPSKYDSAMLLTHEREKLINAIIFFAKHTRFLGKTKLCKLLYFLDFEHYKETGRSVTGMDYYAWKMGPVPVDLYEEVEMPEPDMAANVAFVEKLTKRGPMLTVKPLAAFDGSLFSKRELRIMQSLAEEFRDVQSDDIIEATHLENEPWHKIYVDEGKPQHRIPYTLALRKHEEDAMRDVS